MVSSTYKQRGAKGIVPGRHSQLLKDATAATIIIIPLIGTLIVVLIIIPLLATTTIVILEYNWVGMVVAKGVMMLSIEAVKESLPKVNIPFLPNQPVELFG